MPDLVEWLETAISEAEDRYSVPDPHAHDETCSDCSLIRVCAAVRQVIEEYREAQEAERIYAEMGWPVWKRARCQIERSDAAARARALYSALHTLAEGYGYQEVADHG